MIVHGAPPSPAINFIASIVLRKNLIDHLGIRRVDVIAGKAHAGTVKGFNKQWGIFRRLLHISL